MKKQDDWIHTKALFMNDDDDISELIGKEQELVLTNFSFKKSHVIAFNDSSTTNMTCIRLSSGFDITINMCYDDFKKIIESE
jgi:hypothetical protein